MIDLSRPSDTLPKYNTQILFDIYSPYVVFGEGRVGQFASARLFYNQPIEMETIMDETTKILIGTISGFVIAFLAEPVKTYFQVVFRRKNLRRMLYQEVFENFARLQNVEGDEASTMVFKKVATSIIKIDCYNYAISNELSIYYQLHEVSVFNVLYSTIQHLLEIDPSPRIRNGLIKLYSIKLSRAIASKDIDIRYLRKLKSKKEVDKILEQLDSED